MLTPITQNEWSRRHANHLLQRAGFGGTPEERTALYELGRDQGIGAAVASLVDDLEDWSSLPFPSWSTEQDPNGDLWDGSSERRRSFVNWYMNLLIEGKPLAAKLFKFLVDHLPIDMGTIPGEARFAYFLRFYDLLRKHAGGSGEFGNFRTLINSVSWSEAMIRMLDLQESSANKINENFGRELLELFTLGVDGGYTEDDVGAAAEAFTGRRLYRIQSPHPDAGTVNSKYLAPEGVPAGSAYQDESKQDLLPKSFLGFDRMPGGGSIVTGDHIIELIFADIQTAKHLSWKLWRYFVSPNPSEALQQEMALRLRNNYDYELRPLMKDIFLSQEFYASEVMGDQIKDASDYYVGMLKQLEIPLPGDRSTYTINERLGYNPIYPPNIAGWPEPNADGNEWMAAGSLLTRLNLSSVWVERNFYALNDWGMKQDLEDYPDIDWERILPREMRSPDMFPLLIEKLMDRFLPLCPLRKSQIRRLHDHYRRTSERMDTLEATKELVRLLMALPEYQMQ